MNDTESSTKTTRTITLTGRRPVKIVEDDWPVIADGSEGDHDNQYEFQANRKWKVWMKVRQHADGRAIVYGCAEYDTHWQSERSYVERAGRIAEIDADLAAVVSDVGATLAKLAPDQADRIGRVSRECVADLPAEEV